MSRLRQLAGRFLLTVIVSLLLLAGLASVLMRHEPASQWLVRQLAGEITALHVQAVQGSLWHGLVIEGISWNEPALKLDIRRLQWLPNWRHLLYGQLRIKTLAVDGLQLRYRSTAGAEPQAIDLPALQLPLMVRASKLTVRQSLLDIDGVMIPVDDLQLSALLHGSRVAVSSLHWQRGDDWLAGGGELSMQDDWPLVAQLAGHARLSSPLAALLASDAVTADLAVAGSISHLQVDYRLHDIGPVSGRLVLEPLLAVPQLTLSARWPQLALHLHGQKLDWQQGELAMAGTMADYRLTLDSGVELAGQLPALSLQLAGHGDAGSFVLQALQLAGSPGHFAGSGRIGWQDGLAWQLAGQLEQADIALLAPQLQGRLAMNISSEGRYRDQLAGDLRLTDMRGDWQGQPLAGYARASLDGLRQLSADVDLHIGEHYLRLLADINDSLAGTLSAGSQDLSLLWPGLSGAVAITAELGGSRQQPQLVAEMTAAGIAYGDYMLDQLRLDSRVGDELAWQWSIHGGSFYNGETQWLDSFSASGKGLLADHQLQLALQQGDSALQWQLAGGLEHGRWLGQLQQGRVSGRLAGHWQQLQPAALQLDRQQLQLAQTCLQQHNGSGRLCVQADGPLAAPAVRINLAQLPLQWLAHAAGQPLQLDGVLDGTLAVQRQDDRWQLAASLSNDSGSLSWLEQAGEQWQLLEWQQLRLQAGLDGQQLTASGRWQMDRQQQLAINLSAALDDTAPLAGHVSLVLDDLRWLELLLPVTAVSGRLQGDWQLAGSLSAPQFAGRLEVLDANMQVPDAGIRLQSLNLAVSGTADRQLQLAGELQTGDGQLQLQADVDAAAGWPWPLQARLTGDNVLLVDRDDMRLRVSPDIRLAISGWLIRLRGGLAVEEALLKPRELPARVIRPSADVELAGQQPADDRWQIDSDITLQLGEQARFDGFGLNARFAGDVRLQDKPQAPLTLDGVVTVHDGRYKAYGQNLSVERGNLYFQGAPDNPGLDILAMRDVPAHNVRAGLQIGGTLQRPESRVISIPAMEETEAMAFLLTGKPLSGASESDGNAMLQAVAVYGIEQGEFITARLSQTLGLDVGFDTDGDADQAAFMLGKQLSPNLYVRYSVGLFEAMSTIMLRYSLSDTLSLETRSRNDAQSIDLLYRQERD
ncbi:MAG TPA: translocation/assembly module TamB domain-containing protein [Pseudomonadales bacterium]